MSARLNGMDGRIGEVAATQLLKHEPTWLAHRESPSLRPELPRQTPNAGSAACGSVRRRSGFVQVGW
jgi:hypothetical protein